MHVLGSCIKYLACQQCTTREDFKFHSKCAHLKISHLAYVNELLLLSRGDLPSITILVSCLHEFGEMTELQVGMNESTKRQLLEGVMPFGYLGILLASERLKIANYKTFVNSLIQRIKSWPKQSYVGKTQLIILVLQGVECFKYLFYHYSRGSLFISTTFVGFHIDI